MSSTQIRRSKRNVARVNYNENALQKHNNIIMKKSKNIKIENTKTYNKMDNNNNNNDNDTNVYDYSEFDNPSNYQPIFIDYFGGKFPLLHPSKKRKLDNKPYNIINIDTNKLIYKCKTIKLKVNNIMIGESITIFININVYKSNYYDNQQRILFCVRYCDLYGALNEYINNNIKYINLNDFIVFSNDTFSNNYYINGNKNDGLFINYNENIIIILTLQYKTCNIITPIKPIISPKSRIVIKNINRINNDLKDIIHGENNSDIDSTYIDNENEKCKNNKLKNKNTIKYKIKNENNSNNINNSNNNTTKNGYKKSKNKKYIISNNKKILVDMKYYLMHYRGLKNKINKGHIIKVIRCLHSKQQFWKKQKSINYNVLMKTFASNKSTILGLQMVLWEYYAS